MPIERIQTSRSGIGPKAGTNTKSKGKNSVALGFGTTASNSQSFAFGNNSVSSGATAFAVGANCIASGGAAFAMGNDNTASGNYSIAMGNGNSSTGSYSISAGYENSSTGTNSIGLGSYSTASGSYSIAFGYRTSSTRYGQISHSAGRFTSNGDAQNSRFVLRNSTTDATATELKLDGFSEYLTIDTSRTMSFAIRIAAHRTDVSGTAAAWPSITGGITRDSSGNCRLLGSIVGAGTTAMCDAGASTWSVAVTADSTNNRLAITVTGESSKTIRWAASVDMAEVG